jgi:hypothetical protein
MKKISHGPAPTSIPVDTESIAEQVDTRLHQLKVLLRGRQEPMFFPFEANELDRLFGAVQNEDPDESEVSFIMFDSGKLRVAINLHAAVFFHFLWDAAIGVWTSSDEDGDGRAKEDSDDHPSQSAHVYFAGNQQPTIINAESEDGEDLDNEQNYFNFAFDRLDSGGMRAHERLHIVDGDGESAFLRAGDISLLTCPLWVLYKHELRALGDEDEE